MSDKSIKYTATLDDNPFAAGTRRVGELLSGMQQRFSATGRQIGGVTEGITGQVGKLTESVRAEVTAMGGHFSGLLQAVGNTRLGFVGLIAAAAGLAASKAVGATAKMTEEAMDLARVLGTSTNVAQQWKIALEDVGASQGDLEGAAKGMSRQLKENEADLKAMGLATRDASGNLRPMNELLTEGLGILNQHKEGADRALASATLFGRGVDASSKLLLVNQGTLEDATATMRELGLEVGENAVAAWKDYDAATDRAGFSVKGLVNTVGKILMPVMTDLVNMFNAAMPAAITVVKGAIGGLSTAWHGLVNGVTIAWEVTKAFLFSVTDPLVQLGTAFGQLITGDFKGAAETMMGWPSRIGQAWSQAWDNIATSSQRARDRIAAIWGDDSAPGAAEGARGTKTFTAPPDKAKKDKAAAADPSFMQYYEAALSEEKRLAAEKDALREYTKQQEAAYWQNLLQHADLVGKDRVAITKKVADLELQILREAAKQRQALDLELLKGQQDKALGAVEAARQEAQGQFALGEITRAEMLEQERAFEEQRTEIRRQYLQARLGLIDPDRDPVAYEQISQQIEELERQHTLRLGQIRVEALAESRAAATQVAGTLESGFASVFARIGTSIRSVGDLMRGMGQVVLQTFTQLLAQMAAKWLVNKLLMKAISKATALGEISAEAGKAGAAGVASWAGAPWPINAGAPAFGAAMSAAALSFMPLASAAQGWDIPAGLNPLTQLHEQEMVLPKEHADTIRALGGSGGGGARSVELKAVPMPGNFFMVHRDALANALREMHRDGSFSLT